MKRDTGRTQDIMELYRDLDRETNPDRRQSIRRTITAIKGESGSIRSMREALIKAHRSGDKAEIADIHDFIQKKQKYGSNKQF